MDIFAIREAILTASFAFVKALMNFWLCNPPSRIAEIIASTGPFGCTLVSLRLPYLGAKLTLVCILVSFFFMYTLVRSLL